MMILLNTWCVPTAHPCLTLVTTLNELEDSRIVAKCCTHKAFKKGKGARECGARLAKRVVRSNRKECFYPFKVYCFNSVISQLETLLKRPNFADKCEHWRQREVTNGLISDIYDGQVWKDFLSFKGQDFLKSPRSLAFGLNVDWFQPYSRRSDVSVGVIYLVLLNLQYQGKSALSGRM